MAKIPKILSSFLNKKKKGINYGINNKRNK